MLTCTPTECSDTPWELPPDDKLHLICGQCCICGRPFYASDDEPAEEPMTFHQATEIYKAAKTPYEKDLALVILLAMA